MAEDQRANPWQDWSGLDREIHPDAAAGGSGCGFCRQPGPLLESFADRRMLDPHALHHKRWRPAS
jgi:hypothetical protein